MFGSAVLDILIGLILVFLSVGLAVTAGVEAVSQWLSLRPKQLKSALIGMLDGGDRSGSHIAPGHWFFDQPLLHSMSNAAMKIPSYIDNKTFSEALLLAIDRDYANKNLASLLASLQKLNIDAGVKELISNYLTRANGDVDTFRALVESWFERVMDRATGWYKRNISTVTLLVSVFIVVAGNIDSMEVAKSLYGDPVLRARMLTQAQQTVADKNAPQLHVPGASPPGAIGKELSEVRSAGLPLGWQGVTPQPTCGWWLTKLIGWLITIAAASLGAPFWFDVLTKFVNIRSAGPKPEPVEKKP